MEYHNLGYSKATKSRFPVKLVYTEKFGTKSKALKREKKIKSYKSKKYIKWLIENNAD
jgi:putative endonuclease